MLHQFTNIPPSEMLSIKAEHVDFNDFLTATNGFGEVIFQAGIWSGIIFFIAVFINSPVAALYAFVGSVLGACLAHINGEPIDTIHMGLFGCNAVLSAIVFSGFKKIDGLWVLVAVVITLIINLFLVDYNLLSAVGGVFTFPFVAATWITLLIQKIFIAKNKA